MTGRLAWLLLAIAACSKKPVDPERAAGSASAPAGSAVVVASSDTPAWTLTSAPVELTCGNQPIEVGPPEPGAPAADRALPRARAFTVCQRQASVEAACTCLAASVAQWAKGTGITAPAICVPAPHGNAAVQLVEVSNVSDEDSDITGGSAFVLLAARGASWSAAGIVEVAPAVDLSLTPAGIHSATITGLDTRVRGDATWVWTQSQNEFSETGMGDQAVTGAAAISICVVPSAIEQPLACYAPIKLASWDYVLTIGRAGQPDDIARGDAQWGESAGAAAREGTASAPSIDACRLRDATVMSVRLDSTGAVVVKLEAGVDKAGAAGRYRL